jgi:hypothetical protein
MSDKEKIERIKEVVNNKELAFIEMRRDIEKILEGNTKVVCPACSKVFYNTEENIAGMIREIEIGGWARCGTCKYEFTVEELKNSKEVKAKEQVIVTRAELIDFDD